MAGVQCPTVWNLHGLNHWNGQKSFTRFLIPWSLRCVSLWLILMTDSFRVQVYLSFRWKTQVGLQQTKVSCAACSCVENSRLPVQIMTAQITDPTSCGNFSVLMFSASTVTAQDVNFGTQCLLHPGNHSKTMSTSPRQSQQDNVYFTPAITARQCQFHPGNHSKTMSISPRQTLLDNVNFTSANTARQC